MGYLRKAIGAGGASLFNDYDFDLELHANLAEASPHHVLMGTHHML